MMLYFNYLGRFKAGDAEKNNKGKHPYFSVLPL